MYSWWWVGLSSETCRVKPLRRINAIVASCWIYFTIINKPLLLHLFGCLYYLYQRCTAKQISTLTQACYYHQNYFSHFYGTAALSFLTIANPTAVFAVVLLVMMDIVTTEGILCKSADRRVSSCDGNNKHLTEYILTRRPLRSVHLSVFTCLPVFCHYPQQVLKNRIS